MPPSPPFGVDRDELRVGNPASDWILLLDPRIKADFVQAVFA